MLKEKIHLVKTMCYMIHVDFCVQCGITVANRVIYNAEKTRALIKRCVKYSTAMKSGNVYAHRAMDHWKYWNRFLERWEWASIHTHAWPIRQSTVYNQNVTSRMANDISKNRKHFPLGPSA